MKNLTYILFGLGVLFILLGFVDVFPKVKQNYLDLEEIQRWHKQKNEVNQAKEDLEFLLEELKNVSDQAVKSIEAKINEAKIINFPDKAKLSYISEQDAESDSTKNITKANNCTDIIKDKPNKVKNNIDNKSEKKSIASDSNNNNIIDKHTYIYQLSKQGVSVEEIAQKVQMGKGEVELIIGIKRRGEQA